MSRPRLLLARAQGLRVPVWLLAIGCCALAAASVEQHLISWDASSHFAQVRALDRGTARIDPYRHTTGDRAIYRGHFYSDKAPGMTFLLLPIYRAVRSVGVLQPGGLGMMHVLVLFGCVLPLALILLLAYRLVERSDPGRGAAVAVTLGLGTLLLPFATMLFSHDLSAAMGFAAFYLLVRERRGGLPLVAGAGILGGYAITTEYPLALLVALLGVVVAWRRSPLKPLLVYGAGIGVGLLPLVLYDWWAFGSPLHLSYQYVAANSSGLLGLGVPSVWAAVQLLISGRGLFVVTPVTAAAIAGIVILYREGRRLEALVPAAICGTYLAYNASYYLPFGGAVPGPRFLITVLPFLAAPLAASYRKAPLATLALAIPSVVTMMTATITVPILSMGWSTSIWWSRLDSGWFSTHGITAAFFVAFALLAVIAAARATLQLRLFNLDKLRVSNLDARLTVLGLASWIAVRRAVPALVAHYSATGRTAGLVALLALVVAIAALLSVGTRRGLTLLAGLPLIALGLRRFDNPAMMLTLVTCSTGLLLGFATAGRPPPFIRFRALAPDSRDVD